MGSRFTTDDDGDACIDAWDDNGFLTTKFVEDMDVVDVTDNPDCVVCLKTLRDNDLVALAGGHCQCLECSDDWEKTAAKAAHTCPVCRSTIDACTVCVAKVCPRGAGTTEDPMSIN